MTQKCTIIDHQQTWEMNKHLPTLLFQFTPTVTTCFHIIPLFKLTKMKTKLEFIFC